MAFCQVWIVRRASTSKLTKPQTFPLEKPRDSNSGLRFSLVFWMSLYKDYPPSSLTATQQNWIIFIPVIFRKS